MININYDKNNIYVPCCQKHKSCTFKILTNNDKRSYYCSLFFDLENFYNIKALYNPVYQEYKNLLHNLYSSKDKSLALLNIKSNSTGIKLLTHFILGIDYCIHNYNQSSLSL